jgi:hypothetical protein
MLFKSQHATMEWWVDSMRSVAHGRPGLHPNVAGLGSTRTLMWAGGAAPARTWSGRSYQEPRDAQVVG